jgi:hypothetical protein
MWQIWDTITYQCVQTIVGHRCEIWSMQYIPNSVPSVFAARFANEKAVEALESFGMIITGSADDLIRGYVFVPSEIVPKSSTISGGDVEEVLMYFGCLKLVGGENCSGSYILENL